MSSFIGRKNDLEFLESLYKDPKFRACAVIGRRRIGKTALIKKFAENKQNIYFEFSNTTMELNLMYISEVMSKYIKKRVRYTNLFEFMRDLSELCAKKDYVFIFDEYPFVCNENHTFSALLQHFLDNDVRDSFVIISGSSIHMLEHEISAYSEPLYGRVRKFRLKEMPYSDTREFHPDMDDKERFKLYLITGGVPFYLINTPSTTFREYIERYIIPENSVFHEEGENLFHRELPSSKECILIIRSMGAGYDDVKSLSNLTQINRVTFKKIFDTMIQMGFVSMINPMLGSPTKIAHYRIEDPFLYFYYNVLDKKQYTDYESMKYAIDTHLGRAFETYCMKFIKTNYSVSEMGKWWGSIPKRDNFGNIVRDDNGKAKTESIDIDIVTKIHEKGISTMLFVECKFHNDEVGIGTVRKLNDRVNMISKDLNSRMAIVSISGFDEDVIDYSQNGSLLLIGPDELFGRKPCPRL